MNQRVVALVGISGVGKSTFLQNLSEFLIFQHLEASVLIKRAREVSESRSLSVDSIRQENIDDNQQLLIAEFSRSTDSHASLVIMDGHSVIDTPDGLTNVDPSVFSALGITTIFFLADVPTAIAERRRSDRDRQRPVRTADEIRAHQEAALLNAFYISLSLRIPLITINSFEISEFMRLIEKSNCV